MNRTPVISSNVSSVGYDENDSTLEVQFRDGSVYQYFKVPSQIYTGLINAASVGGFLNDHIKDVYPYRRV
jgi:hypothetical protein